MSDSRQTILDRLQRNTRPFPHAESPSTYIPVVPLADPSPTDLSEMFIAAAKKAGCTLHEAVTPAQAVRTLLEIVGDDDALSCWRFDQIGLPGLEDALREAEIRCVAQDAGVRVGATGVDAALAATGSVVLRSGDGRYRASSLLPPVHVAVVRRSQIMPDLESWWALEREQGLGKMREASNIVVVTGPSRTADIALTLVMGMHGPRAVHIILIDDQ